VESIDAEHGLGDETLFQRKYRLPIFLAITIGMFNQLAGINAILYYLNDIFAYAGFSKVSSDRQAVLVGFTNLIFTMLAMSVIDKVGRKKLLLTGAVGTALCLAGVAAIFATNQRHDLLIWLLVAYIAFFAFSQGAVIWVYISEVFPNRVRAKGQSLGSSTHWIMNALISFVFPVLAAKSKPIPFVFFAAMMVLQFVVVLLVYPETKGVSLEDMQKKLTAG
jgi:MFS family permease